MMLNKIKSLIDKIKNYSSHQSCYNTMERSGKAIFSMCSGVVGGDITSDYLSCQCMDCPYFVPPERSDNNAE